MTYSSNHSRATLQSDAASAVRSDYSTNQYRALLPTYVSAIFAWWLDSSYKGFALVDLLGWWLAAWTLYYLARHLGTDNSSALIAAVLLAASPLLVSKMWNHGLNVAHHSSLVPYSLIALVFFDDKRLGSIRRIALLTSVLYAASLTYHYQWIIAPCLLSLAVVGRWMWEWIISIVASIFLFVALTSLTHQIMSAVGISVYPSLNDPLTAVTSRFTHVISGDVPELENLFLPLVYSLIRAYSFFIVALFLLGLIFSPCKAAHPRMHRNAIGLGIRLLPWCVLDHHEWLSISVYQCRACTGARATLAGRFGCPD